jgi:hypothetical protein
MQQIIRKFAAIKLLALAALLVTTSSFTGAWGGDTYRVYVNNKLVLEQFVHMQKSIPAIRLDLRSPNDEIRVYYTHCGQVGHARNLTLKDNNNKVLKQWKFADVSSSDGPMSCKAADIMGLSKANGRLGLYYSAKEAPGGKLLAVVSVGRDDEARP